MSYHWADLSQLRIIDADPEDFDVEELRVSYSILKDNLAVISMLKMRAEWDEEMRIKKENEPQRVLK